MLINLLLFPIASNAQYDDYFTENFFIDEGFPVIRILGIFQDHDGLIWICSERQLHTFNGSQFELKLDFSNSNFYPKKILFDNRGNIWMLEYENVFAQRYNTKLKNIKIFNKKNEELELKEYLNLSEIKIEKIFQNHLGDIIFKHDNTFYSFDKETRKLNLPKETSSLIYNDSEIVLVNNQHGAAVLDKSTNQQLFQFDKVEAYKVRKNGSTIYILFTDGTLRAFDKKINEGHLISETILNHELLTDFFFNRDGDLMVVKRRGISKYSLDDLQEIKLTNNNPSIPYYTAVFKDIEENIWIGTNLGINKLTKKQKTFLQKSDSFYFSTRNISYVNEENLFISTYSGNFLYNVKTSEYSHTSNSGVILDMVKNNEQYFSINHKNILTKETILPNKIIQQKQFPRRYKEGKYPGTLFKSSRDKMYLLLDHLVYSFDSLLNHKIAVEDKSESVFFNKAYEYNNNIYLISSNGVYIYDQNFNFKRKFLEGVKLRLMHQDLEDENIIWFSTASELLKYNVKNDTYRTFDSSMGFLNTTFTTIIEDTNGNLWLPSFAGLNKFNKESENIQIYFEEDGLSNNEFNNYSYLKLEDNRHVFGSISGVTFVDTKATDIESSGSFQVQIYSCKVLTSKASSRLDLIQEISETNTLKFKESFIEAELKLSHHSYNNLKSKLFRYRVYKKGDTPLPNSWVNLLSNEISLIRKPYGEYILEYEAVNRYGNLLSKTNKIELQYLKPWYKSLLSRLLAIVLLFFGISFFSQRRSKALVAQKLALETEVIFRIQQIEKQKQELENINSTKDKLFSILAHDLKSPLITLSNISGKINYLIRKNQPDRIIELGKTIEDKVSNLTIFLDNLLNWAIQQRGHFNYTPKQLSIQSITNEIINLYDDVIQEKEIIIEQDIPINSSCYADENSIKTVIRNIVHNAIKYSPKAGIIKIKHTKGDNYHTLAISDMGAGIPKVIIEAVHKKEHIKNTPGTNGEKGTGLGFLISKELMDLNKGQMVFLSNKGRGTTVELLLPISQ